MVLGFKASEDFQAIYEASGVRNIFDGLAPAFQSRPVPIEAASCEPVEGQPNLFLLPGHIGLAEYEVTLGIAQELSGSLVTLQNLPGSLHHLFQKTADAYEADYILVDMSPSLGPINQNLLMTSHYFLVPMTPDYFSVMVTDSLASVIPKWHAWSKRAGVNAALQHATYPYPNVPTKFLGTVVQKYRIRQKETPSKAFQKWIDKIIAGVEEKLIPALRECDMLLPSEKYEEVGLDPRDPLLQMSDFNSLIALSQQFNAPIFSLSDEQIGLTGIVLKLMSCSYSEG
jgi:cellulose biosynthesis protein BcsQ